MINSVTEYIVTNDISTLRQWLSPRGLGDLPASEYARNRRRSSGNAVRRDVPPTGSAPVGTAREDVLRTILRDLHNIRKDIIGGCTCKDALYNVDSLIEHIENYMAEN